MSNPVGTPDWQRGVVSAGKLLATLAQSDTTVTVTVPPNVQVIALAAEYQFAKGTVTVTGVTSGVVYDGIEKLTDYGIEQGRLQYYQILSLLDTQVKITLSSPISAGSWYVYGLSQDNYVKMYGMEQLVQQAGFVLNGWGIVSLGSDGSDAREISTDSNGRQIPLVPTVGVQKTVNNAIVEIVAAPTTGALYLFGLDVDVTTGTSEPITLSDSNGNVIAYDEPPNSAESHSIPLQGFRTTGSVSAQTTSDAVVVLRYATGP